MAIERTLSIVKPDAVAKNVIGNIYNRQFQSGYIYLKMSLEIYITALKLPV